MSIGIIIRQASVLNTFEEIKNQIKMKKIIFLLTMSIATTCFAQVPTLVFDEGQFRDYAGTIISEDFDGGPGAGNNICGPIISSAGDGCFPSDEIEEEFNVTASNNSDLSLLDIGFLSNQTINLVGASNSNESTIINFSEPVFAVGFTLYNATGEFITITIYDTNGNTIGGDVSIWTDFNEESFTGIITTEAISHIEIDGDENSKEYFGSLLFTAQNGPGDGSSACDEAISSNNFENGYPYWEGIFNGILNDITVGANEDFELNTIRYNSYHINGETIQSVDVNYYAFAGGLPGVLIGSQPGVVPTSQTLLGNDSASGFDVSEIMLDVNPILFEGRANITTTYWVELTNGVSSGGGELYWEISSNEMNGNPMAIYDYDAQVFYIPPPANFDGVYAWGGNCTVLGISEDEIEGFRYYPNPATNELNLAAFEPIENVSIYNLLGQKVMDRSIGHNNSKLDISQLSNGTYILKIQVGTQIGTYKILKQ